MRRFLTAAIGLLLTLGAAATPMSAVENTWDLSVQVSATVESAPAKVTLTWPQDTNGVPASYTVFRKAPGASSWGTGTTLSGTATSYVDSNVAVGTAYEYRIVKAANSYTGYGYVQAGIQAPLVDTRGKIVLVVDKTFTTSLASELSRLERDLRGDGWVVLRREVSRTDTPQAVKAVIKAAYDTDPANVKSVFLFGHVPVPYSGQFNPDGHPDHIGAWPADVYYGDLDGNWTDDSVNYTQTLNTDKADAARMSNVPGDGKFDQTNIPSAVELEVGRVDLSNLPGRTTWGGPATFASETELLRKYLNKDHEFRHARKATQRRAILGDYFGYRGGEAFAASGFRSFAPLVGANNIRNLNTEFSDQRGVWISELSKADYLLAYGCGAGAYDSISGIGNTGLYNGGTTSELVQANTRGVFNLIFGSWLGDWDHEDNILRAPLATDHGLVSVWSGRPHWYIHPMGLGETIGHATRLTQNNNGLYQTQINSAQNRVHIALMGDPTLRLHPVAPATNLNASLNGNTIALTWSASSDSNVVGYHVYRADSATGEFTRLTSSPITATTFSHNSAGNGATYMVRAIKLETSASGSYLNAAQGAFYTVGGANNTDTTVAVTPSTNTSNTTTPVTSTSNTTTSSAVTPTGNTPNTAASTASALLWIDDALPAGAGGSSNWNWITADPAPYAGSKSRQTALKSSIHDYTFNWAAPLAIASGDVVFTYVYIDPANPPSEIMLSFNSDNWEHRAYWGSNDIAYGTNNTNGRRYIGTLPAAGQWTRLEIPASVLGLEGASITGMGVTLFNGRAAFDATGKSQPGAIVTPATSSPTSTTPATNPVSVPDASLATASEIVVSTTTVSPIVAAAATTDKVWFDDALPAGATGGATGGDAWTWVDSSPTPISGKVAHRSAAKAGLHEHSFNWASETLKVDAGDKLFVYAYIDPANKPTEIMLSWLANDWEHRAYWGDDKINYGKKGTTGRYYMGAIPKTGEWVRLEIPASAVGLEGATLHGMSFSLFDGRVTWDKAGKFSGSTTTTPTNPTNPSTPTIADSIWVDDALPAGASGSGTGGDTWNWVTSNPSPVSGAKAQQTVAVAGLHETSFNWAGTGMNVASGSSVFAYVYIDAANPPSSIMLSWFADNWEHRAYWGENKINYGTTGTAGRYYAGALPAAGQWARLEVPASAVALAGKTVTGMGFSLYNGRVSFDKIGTGAVTSASTPGTTPSIPSEPSNPGTTTPTNPGTTTPTNPGTTTPTNPGTTTPTNPGTTTPVAVGENDAFRMPQVGDNRLRIISGNVLELQRITTKEADPATVKDWNFVNASNVFTAPAASEFAVTVNGSSVSVKSVGFRRRVAYAPQNYRDLRIDNCLYLELNGSVAEGANVEVKNPSGALWSSSMQFKATAAATRYSPAIHVNQEGYVPSLPKKAMVGFYLGNLGELTIDASAGFKIVNASTGATVHTGTLVPRRETGFNYAPAPYQKVLEADFSSFQTPGEYQLVVPGLGASLPFLVNDGIAMSFTRTYAAGLYHQRCGAECKMPFSRFEHAACHMLPAEVPSPQSSYDFTWRTIASKNEDAKSNARHTAPRLDSEAAQLYPFVNKGKIDVSGGHHDAGDYSKYTINVAQLVHILGFTAESINGAGALDNLGLPESGDGISDILQEAKHEADYLAKLQDADGGFYFIVYPKTRAYEGDVTPDKGDQQVVWPKNTSATAAAVGALAQMASSPKFKAAYPQAAASYLEKAKKGWQFLMLAIAKHGKDGSYQKVTFYGDTYMHDDELAWAAAEMFVATGDAQYHQKLMEWFPKPDDSNTFRFWWWRMSESYGNAIRAYAFAARSGRLPATALNAAYLAKCEEQIKLAGDDALTWTRQGAYANAFPDQSKHYLGAGWFFSLDQASDMAVAYQLNPKADYIDALVSNMNYEGGTNPVNVTFVSGLGMKRQRELVNQWANTDHRKMPMPGIPAGNVTAAYSFLGTYGASGNELAKLSYPTDDTGGDKANMYPFYDRWADTWNVTAEFITVNQARSVQALAALAAQTNAKGAAWKPSASLSIVAPTNVVEVGTPTTLKLNTNGLDLSGARILWEARDQEPDYGTTYTISPKNPGTQWVEVEITWPDGRRMFGASSFSANASLIVWLDDVTPLGANPTSLGGDGWNWLAPAGITPQSGLLVRQTPAGSGLREHAFGGAWTPLTVGAGDTMFVWVYLDPANRPEELMVHWNDGSWDHRAFWGADKISYGTLGTAGRYRVGDIPTASGWVKLEVPAKAVGLEGKSINGMCFSTFGGGRVLWDSAGRTSPKN